MNTVAVLSILVASVIAQEPLTLKYASLVFRHGDRSPVSTYPNDPYKEEDWPQGYDQLSFNGTQQHFQLGRLIRKRYTVEHQLINPNYTRDEVYVRSTDYDRTLMSALSQLSGLFPPDEDQKLNGTIVWQPIPVHTVPLDDESLLLTTTCPRYLTLLGENTQTDYYEQVNKEHEQFYANVEVDTGVSDLDLYSTLLLADTVFVEKRCVDITCTDEVLVNNPDVLMSRPTGADIIQQWGRNPGDWVNATVSKTLENLTDINFVLFFKRSNALEKQRLASGNLVGQIADRMKNKTINDTFLVPGTNLVLYSGHDFTVAGILSALQVYDDIRPQYASTVFVELYSDSSSNYFVRLFYLNNNTIDGFDLTNTTSLLTPLQIPDCDPFCPLDKFINLTAGVVPSDWEKECQNNESCSVSMISGKFNHNSKRSRTRFRFSSDGDSRVTYKCKLDDERFEDCKSPIVWRNLERGRHTVNVRAFCRDSEDKTLSSMRKVFKFRIR